MTTNASAAITSAPTMSIHGLSACLRRWWKPMTGIGNTINYRKTLSGKKLEVKSPGIDNKITEVKGRLTFVRPPLSIGLPAQTPAAPIRSRSPLEDSGLR